MKLQMLRHTEGTLTDSGEPVFVDAESIHEERLGGVNMKPIVMSNVNVSVIVLKVRSGRRVHHGSAYINYVLPFGPTVAILHDTLYVSLTVVVWSTYTH